MNEAETRAEHVDPALAALDELKKSLLHQAFTGQLTAELGNGAPQPRSKGLP